MRKARPIFDAATHYRVVVQGRVDVKWLQDFDELAEIIVDEPGQMEGSTLLSVHTDQAGIVGLMRRLHGLGMAILQLQIVSDERRIAEAE